MSQIAICLTMQIRQSRKMAFVRRHGAPTAGTQKIGTCPPPAGSKKRGQRPRPAFAVSRLRAKPPSPHPRFRHDAKYRENAILRGGLAPTPAYVIQGSNHPASWFEDAPRFIYVPECSTPLLGAARPALKKVWHPKDCRRRGQTCQNSNKRACQ